jgi:hypothetical protein
MSNQFKPLDKDRKTGIVLIFLTIGSFILASHTGGNLQVSFVLMGMSFFVWLLALMGKSVDENGGWDENANGDAYPADNDRPTEEDLQFFTVNNRKFKPLDRERKLGIVFFVLTFAAFIAASYTVGWLQVAAYICGMVSFLTIFVLMGRSVDKQNEEAFRRKRDRRRPDDDQ